MSRAEVRLSDAALWDILEQADWYEQRSGEALAERWGNKVASALIRIEKNPNSGAKCNFNAEQLRGIRRMPIAGFPRHLIFYRVEGDEVKIFRVVHGARDLESLF
jgi:toxin ParE1/3/4